MPRRRCRTADRGAAGRRLTLAASVLARVAEREAAGETIEGSPVTGRELAYSASMTRPRPAYPLKKAVYRIDPRDGTVQRVTAEPVAPNGLCFSHDYKRLFIVDTGTGAGDIKVYDRRMRSG